MSRKDLAIHTTDDSVLYCSECLEKLLPWTTSNRTVLPSWVDNFHPDLYGLIRCSNRCPLCAYICNLFGRSHLEGFLARAEEHNAKPEPVSNKTGYDISSSRPSKGAPSVSIRYYTQNSRFNSDGHVDHVVAVILLQHHVTKVWHDRKAFMIYTEAGRAFRRAIWSQANAIGIKARSATIRAWLTECQTHHLACRKTENPEAPIAARILAVQEHLPGIFLIKLVSTESIDLRNEPHLVLSHVWGGIEIHCKTTSASISHYQDVGIDFDILPKTFQDAVQITAAIGFQYLWIDSLCIIQDDDEDWQRESAKMAAIFHTATITLSATSAKNGNEGCGLTVKHGKSMRFGRSDGKGLSFVVRETTEAIPSAATILDNHLRNAPVSTRAWILQEQKLSRRILHAMDSQLVWECGMMTESEDSIVHKQESNAPKVTSQAHLDSRVPYNYRSGKETASPLGMYGFGYHWWKCVEDYSTRSLTYSTDRYAALAGIVQFHQEKTGDSPVVGLWKQNLAIHLAWAVYHDSREHITPVWDATNRRPSWTWMSFLHGSVRISEPISWSILQTVGSREGDLGIVYQAHILHTDVKWSGRPLTSDPRGSTIHIRGMMHRRPRPKPARPGIRSPLHLDPGVAEPSDGSGEYDALALFAHVQSATLRNHPPYVTTTYLIIKPTTSENENEYMRIGRMQLIEPFNMDCRHEYLPEGTQRDITLV